MLQINGRGDSENKNCTKVKAVFTIIENERLERPLFRRIGTGFVNRDGSINIVLDALPVSGKLHLRDLEPKEKTEGAEVIRPA